MTRSSCVLSSQCGKSRNNTVRTTWHITLLTRCEHFSNFDDEFADEDDDDDDDDIDDVVCV